MENALTTAATATHQPVGRDRRKAVCGLIHADE
jgi:hypothetical protein